MGNLTNNKIIELDQKQIDIIFGGSVNCTCCNSTEVANICQDIYKEMAAKKNEFELTELGKVWMSLKITIITSFVTIASITVCYPKIAAKILPSKTLPVVIEINKLKQQ